DPVFEGRAIARALNLPDRVRKRDVARYMYGEPLQYDPGDSTTYDADHRYSNFGYLLLACLVEEVTGVSFEKYLQDELLAPIGAADQVWVGAHFYLTGAPTRRATKPRRWCQVPSTPGRTCRCPAATVAFSSVRWTVATI